MVPEIEHVVRHKRLLLFEEMLSRVSFPSRRGLIGCLVSGFPLGGAFPNTEVLKPKPRLAEQSLEDLWRSARRVQARTFASTRASDDRDLDNAVHAATAEEVAKGGLVGPFFSCRAFVATWRLGALS